MKKSVGFSAVFLLIVVLVTGAILKLADNTLAPLIDSGAIAQDKPVLDKMFPGAAFAPVETTDDSGVITAAYEAEGQGFAYKATVPGYVAPITFIVGFGNDGVVKGLEMIEVNDTQGIGSRVGEAPFIDSIVGKTSTDAFATISGATVSSSAVVSGINAAKADFNERQGIVDDGTSTPEPVATGINFGSEIKIHRELGEKTKGTIESQTEDEGDVVTYTVLANGYKILEEGESVAPNKILVTINKESDTIVKVEVAEVNDTKGLGSLISEQEFLDQFTDLSITDEAAGIDAISGATVSSESAVNAVKAAIDEAVK
ncbi:MAG TPA: FMN-binding protein [Clostridiaceae bacterium]|nr:FMN-binding protein [Clostridiaceae bacterium]